MTYTIAGVAPAPFFGPEVGRSFDVAVPLGAAILERGNEAVLDGRSHWWLQIMGRLKPGQTVEDASARLERARLVIREEAMPLDWVAEVKAQFLSTPLVFRPAASGPSDLRARYETPLTTLMVVVGLVLLIACGNIANLLLARATSRRHEFSVRLALGASRGRLARQLLAESVMLSAIGAALGLFFARWTAPLVLRQLASASNAPYLDLSTDWRVLGFTIAVAMLTAVIFGSAPAFSASRVAPNDALKAQGRSVAGDGRFTFRNALVVAQVALSLVLVVGVALFTQTFARLATLDLGFDPEPLLVVSVTVPPGKVPPPARLEMFSRFRDAAAAVPGVSAAAVSFITPVSGSAWNTMVEIPGHPQPEDREVLPMVHYVTPGWFDTYGTALTRGRDLHDRDRAGAPLVVVVNDAFVRAFFPDTEPLGQTVIEPSFRESDPRRVYQVVGIVRDAVYRRLREPVPATMYLPMAQFTESMQASVAITVRSTSGPPSLLTRPLVDAFSAVEPDTELTVTPLVDRVHGSLAQERLVALMSSFFGVLALVLAGLGLYGVTAYAVDRRRREIGVRLALGARPGGVVALVLGRVVWLVGLGVAGGAVLSIWASTYVGSLLFGVTARDPAAFVVSAAVLASVGLVASWVPARRAARVDPARVLRDA